MIDETALIAGNVLLLGQGFFAACACRLAWHGRSKGADTKCQMKIK